MIRMTDPCCGRPHAGSRDALSQAVRAALLLMSCALAPQAHAVISQESLIVKELPVVEPNLMFTLDDSGSMSFNFLPDTDLDDHLFALHPAEPRTGYTPWRVQGLLGTGDNDLLAARKRSPQVNTLYYDPDVRYDPWVDGTGVRMPNADPRKVKYHLGHSEEKIASLTMDITGLQPVHQPGMENPYEGTCVRPQLEPKKGQECSVVDRSVTMIAPATYYLLKNPDNKPPVRWTLGDFQSSKDSASNYQRVSIMDHKEFVRANTRTDCKVTSPGANTRTCTQAEEYQNFANWFQYHRTRMHGTGQGYPGGLRTHQQERRKCCRWCPHQHCRTWGPPFRRRRPECILHLAEPAYCQGWYTANALPADGEQVLRAQRLHGALGNNAWEADR